jgi:hypothetical protein
MGEMAVMLNPVLMRSNSSAMPLLAPTPMPLLMRSKSCGREGRQGCMVGAKGGIANKRGKWVGR